MMQIHEIEAIKSLLATPKKITIVPHRNPDGDAMGSTLALYHALKQLQHNVIVMAPNEFPDFLAWLPESEKVIVFERSYDTCKSIKFTSCYLVKAWDTFMHIYITLMKIGTPTKL